MAAISGGALILFTLVFVPVYKNDGVPPPKTVEFDNLILSVTRIGIFPPTSA